MADHTPVKETIDVTITGRSSKAIIVRHKSQKRHMACRSDELLEELAAKLPCNEQLLLKAILLHHMKSKFSIIFPVEYIVFTVKHFIKYFTYCSFKSLTTNFISIVYKTKKNELNNSTCIQKIMIFVCIYKYIICKHRTINYVDSVIQKKGKR